MASSALLSRYAGTMIRSATAHGFTLSSISEAVSLSTDELRSAHFDNATFFRISREIKLLMNDEFCGFTQAPCRVGTFGDMCERVVAAPTVGEALRRAFDLYAERAPDVRFELSHRKEIARVSMTVVRSDTVEQEFLYEWWFLIWPRVASWLAREDIPILAVDLPHAASNDSEEYAEGLAGVCRFGRPMARLLLPERYLHMPVRRDVHDVSTFMAPPGEQMVRGGNCHFKLKLKQLLRENLAKTQSLLSIEDAASHYNMSSQTLRRRLQAEWTSYRLVKEAVRREAALCWLVQERLSIGEISNRSGYAEPNGLTRALKAWTGISPSAYRDDVLM
jgi:AraC-like DNA-binding protein